MRRRRAIAPISLTVPRAGRRGFVLVMALALSSCSLDGLLKSDELPPDKTDPAITKTPGGALAAYHGTIAQFRQAFGTSDPGSFVAVTGLLSDELRDVA